MKNLFKRISSLALATALLTSGLVTAAPVIQTIAQETSSQLTPSNPITYDLENMIGFMPIEGKESYTNYEYSLTAGVGGWADCTSNPQPIPEGDYAVGQVAVRLKQEALDQSEFDPLFNDVAFTANTGIIYDFEDADEVKKWSKGIGNIGHFDDVSRSGNSVVAFYGDSTKKFNYTLNLQKYYENAVLSVWFYDPMYGGTEQMQFNVSNSKAGTGTGGVNNNTEKFSIKLNDKTYYQMRVKNGTSYNTEVKRSEGWHQFVYDYSDGENVVISIDGTEVYKGASSGFDFVSCQDSWSTTPESNKYYFDDLSISYNGETVSVPNAPTNAVVDDNNDTIGFTPLADVPNATDYEFSINAGQTWETCVTNPQYVGGGVYEEANVQVRLKAIDGEKAGAILRSNEAYTSKVTQLFIDLQDEILFAKGIFENDLVAGETVDTFKAKITAAEQLTEDSSEAEVQTALTELRDSMTALEVNLENHTEYNFEENEAELNPFYTVSGTVNKGVINTPFGEDPFDYYLDKFGTTIEYELVNGKYQAETIYTFPQDINDKIVSLAWLEVQNVTATTDLILSNSEGDYIGLRSLPGNQTRYQVITCVDGVEKAEEVPIRRLGQWRLIYWDMANNDTSTKLYLDEREIGEIDGMSEFDKLSVKVYGGTKDTEVTTIDKLQIIEKNPVETINIVDDSAEIGYFETYNASRVLLDIDAKYDDYKTTDILYYTSEDESIVYPSETGTLEGANWGTTTVTVTSQSGMSDSIDITVKDFKIEDMYITDSPIIDVIAIDEPSQQVNNSVPVTELEDITIDINESKALNVVMTPSNATARLPIWESSDESVVHVENGLITGVGYGEATITITSDDGTNVTDTVKVYVKPDSFENGQEIFVATNGDDINGDGTIENPYASIERARDEARVLNGLLPDKGVVIYFREGIYTFTGSLELNDQDSGTVSEPIKYAAYMEEDVTFAGGAVFDTTMMEKITVDDKMYDRIPSGAVNSVYTIDLTQFGIDKRDLQVVGHSAGGLKQFPEAFGEWNFSLPYFSVVFNGDPLTLSRYPNTDYIQTTTIYDDGENPREWQSDPAFEYIPGMEDDTFVFSSSSLSASKLASWSQSIGGDYGAWMSGYWGQVYSDQTVPMGSVDGDKITSGLVSQYEPKAKMNFYVYNLIEELDIAGEWYIDQTEDDSLMLYLFAPTGTDMNDSSNTISIPTLDSTFLDMYETDNIMFTGIDFSSTNSSVANIEGGTNNVIRKADIDNIGGALVSINDSYNADETKKEIAKFNGLQMCDMINTNGGVQLNAGGHEILERGYNFVENCTFYNFSIYNKSYNPAVNINGVGNRVTNTTFREAPHNAIQFKGPESIMEFNEFSELIQTAGDQGAIYTGRDTLNRGSVIRNNYFHNIHHTTSVENAGIFLDDAKAGVLVHDNIFENVGQGLKMNGGRDISIIGNQFINCANGITTTTFLYSFSNHIHNSALGLYAEANDLSSVTTIDWDDPNSAYGRFDTLYYALDDEFGYGKYCTLIDNVFINMERKADPTETITDYNLWSKRWGLMSYEDQKALIHDWFFEKNNVYSNNTGDDDLSYLTRYDINLSVASGEGTVKGSDVEIMKEITRKAVAEPADGYVFSHWIDENGATVSTSSVYFYEINTDIVLKAVFVEK